MMSAKGGDWEAQLLFAVVPYGEIPSGILKFSIWASSLAL